MQPGFFEPVADVVKFVGFEIGFELRQPDFDGLAAAPAKSSRSRSKGELRQETWLRMGIMRMTNDEVRMTNDQ